MSYSDSFPSVSPSWQCNFSANGGRLDPRITFSRSDTPPTYAAPSAVHYWSNEKHLSSENLLLQSSDFDTTWANSRLASPTANQTDPSGGTDGYTLTEDSSSGAHRLTQSVTATGDLAFTVYAKQNSGTRYLTLGFFNGNNDTVLAVYDLAGGSPVTATGSSSTYSSVSTSQTASGNGYYKCVLKATGTVTLAGVNLNDASTTAGLDTTLARKVYTGDGSSSIDVAFASLSSVGGTTYQATTTQIHREYAPTLKSVATAGQPRFEYSPTDSASMGLLIEGSSTNLLNYSEQFDNAYWSKSTGGTSPAINLTITPNAGIAPSGELTADLVVPQNTGGNTVYYIAKNYSFTSGDTYTLSVYVKSASHTEIALQAGNPATWAASTRFTLTGDGSASVSSGSAQIEKCGNGWFRLSVTGTAGATASTNLLLQFYSSGQSSFDGDDYSGVLLWGAMFEQASFASSYIKVEGSTVTRAADSASMDLTQAGYTGGPVSVITETTGGRGSYPRTFSLSDGTITNYANIHRNGTDTDTSTDYRVRLFTDGVSQVDRTASASASATKIGMSIDTNSVISTFDGGSSATDSSAVINTMTTLEVGDQPTGGKQWNGTLKRVSVYGTALSQTELESLTS